MTTKKFTRLYSQEVVVLLRDKTFNKESPSTSASGVEQFTLFTGQMGVVAGVIKDSNNIVKYGVEFSYLETNEEYAIEYIERKHLLPVECFGFEQLFAKSDVKNLSNRVSNLASTVSNKISNFVKGSSIEWNVLAFPLKEDYVHEEQLDVIDEDYYDFEERIVLIEEDKFQDEYNRFFKKHQIHYKRYLDFNFNEGDLVTIKSDIVDENDNEFKISAGQVGMIINPEDPSKLRKNHVQVVFRPLALDQFIFHKDILIRDGKTTLAPIPGISESVNEKLNFEVRGQIHKGLILPIYTDILKDNEPYKIKVETT